MRPRSRTAANSHSTIVDPMPRLGGVNYYLAGDRPLAASWRACARDNIAAIQLSRASRRKAAPIRFTGFGASSLANNCFRRTAKTAFEQAGKTSLATCRTRSTPPPTHHCRAPRNTPTTRQMRAGAPRGPRRTDPRAWPGYRLIHLPVARTAARSLAHHGNQI
jgi:hypothetical protein